MATTATAFPSTTAPAITLHLTGATTGSDETIFTPPSGKRWRLIGWQINGGNGSINTISIKEGSTEIRGAIVSNQVAAPFIQNYWSTPIGHIPHESAVDALLKFAGINTVPVLGDIYIQVF